MARHMNPGSSTNKPIDAIDRKRERERRHLLKRSREMASELAILLVQRLIDQHIIETNSVPAIKEVMERQLEHLADMKDFDMQYKIAPIRNLVPDPNVVSLYLTQYITEDLINHDNIQDIFGDDLAIYTAVDSVLSRIR